MKILRPKLNLASFYSEDIQKAYTEGVNSDTPSNRKLGRVGMSYKDFAEKSHKTKDKKEKDMVNRIPDILDESEVLGKAEGKRLDAIIKYSNSDNLDGIKVDKDAINEKKRITIAKFYIKSAELEGSNKEIADALDGICEDALSDYSLEDENYFNISNTLKKQINKEFDNLLKEVNLSEVDKDDLF